MASKRKPAIKEVFDAHAHTDGLEPSMLQFVVEDRMVAGGSRAVAGQEVASVSRGFLEMVDGSRIPLHKVAEIRSHGALLFKRPRAPRS